MACEDFPCCGHERGDCPDSKGRMRCVECGKPLSKRATSSICPKCLKAMNRRAWNGGDDHDYSMNG
jgi:hypothetical protein